MAEPHNPTSGGPAVRCSTSQMTPGQCLQHIRDHDDEETIHGTHGDKQRPDLHNNLTESQLENVTSLLVWFAIQLIPGAFARTKSQNKNHWVPQTERQRQHQHVRTRPTARPPCACLADSSRSGGCPPPCWSLPQDRTGNGCSPGGRSRNLDCTERRKPNPGSPCRCSCFPQDKAVVNAMKQAGRGAIQSNNLQIH